MKVKTYRILDSNEFDALVKQTYGEHVKYEFVADEEAHNYSSYTYNNMERGASLDAYIAAKLQDFLEGDAVPYMARTLLQDMVNNGILEPGNYMIEVWW